ncbi:MAG: MBL fold metallo-hydrolase [Clostridiales bacterium]|nr:MBL fold metallo-hydrolase [Clostridiales bacterium]
MKVFKLKELSVFGTNSYLVISNDGNGALIDAPADAEYIMNFASEKKCRITKILLTHGHYDHIGASGAIQEKTNCKVYIHQNDKDKLSDGDSDLASIFNLPKLTPPKVIETVKDDDIIKLDEVSFKVIHTPGHTCGSVCYVLDSNDIIFSGDTLFRLSIGRTDMPGGDYPTLVRSLKKLSKLDKNYTIYPGHMDKTTLDFEKINNPYFK